MSYSETITKTDLANILNEIVAIDGTDMTSQEIEDFVDTLDSAAVHAADYVVEEGSGLGWTWTKWNSGKCELWYTGSVAMAIDSAVGSIYQSGSNSTITYPFTLTTVKHCSITLAYDTFGVIPYVMTVGKSSAIYRGVSFISRTLSAFAMTAYVKGTWK